VVLQSFFGTAQNAELAIILNDRSESKVLPSNDDGVIQIDDVQKIHIFGESDTVAGKVRPSVCLDVVGKYERNLTYDCLIIITDIF